MPPLFTLQSVLCVCIRSAALKKGYYVVKAPLNNYTADTPTSLLHSN